MNVALAFVIFTGIALYGDPAVGVTIGDVQAVAGRGGRHRRRRHARRRTANRTSPSSAVKPLDALRANAGKTVTLAVKSADGTTRRSMPRCDPRARSTPHGALGIKARAAVLQEPIHYDLAEAIRIGAQRTVDALGLIVGGLGTLAEFDRQPPGRSATGLRPGRDRHPAR